MQFDCLKVEGVWYLETGSKRFRVEVYQHESRGDYGWHTFENEGGIYRLVWGDSRFTDGTFQPWPTAEEALAAAQDQIQAKLEYHGRAATT